MSIQKRVQFVFLHFKKIGIVATFSYFLQRIIKAKNHLIALRLKGLPHTIYLRNKTYDVHIFYQIFINEDLYYNYGKSIAIILDCGANIGLSSLFYLRKYRNARIIAIEPESRNYELLLKNTCNYNNIICVKTALFANDCDLNLIDTGNGEASYRVMYEAGEGKVLQSVACRSIDSLMKELHLNKIDILKMDIEGSEKECLFAPDQEWLERTKYFLLEIHENIHPGLTKAIYDLVSSRKISLVGEYTLIEKEEQNLV